MAQPARFCPNKNERVLEHLAEKGRITEKLTPPQSYLGSTNPPARSSTTEWVNPHPAARALPSPVENGAESRRMPLAGKVVTLCSRDSAVQDNACRNVLAECM